jgi:thiamine-phosphate pyrophosphorylase
VPAPDFDVYLVTDRTQTRGRDLLWAVEHALDGGVGAVQLREKDLAGGELFTLAEKIRARCEPYGAALLINDRIDVALAVDAAGVQLGKLSLPLETARALLGPNKWIGASIHSVEEIRPAEQAGADFLVFGPVYFTPSKAGFGAPQGLEALKRIVKTSTIPVYGIGGITDQNIGAVRATGARGIALISGIIAASEPRDSARALINLFRS